MSSLLRSLLLLGLPGFEAPQDANRRRLKALHLANRQALLGQQALLYCLLDDHGVARRHRQHSLAELERCRRGLHGLVEGDAGRQVEALAALWQSYGLLLTAAGDDELRRTALAFAEQLLRRSLELAERLASACASPAACWLAQCGQVYGYSQHTLCLLALSEPLARHLDRPALLHDCRERCHRALVELARLVSCHAEVDRLLRDLELLHERPPHEPGAPWLHQVSASLLLNLTRLEGLPL